MTDGGWIPAYRKMFKPDHDLWQGEVICLPMAWLDLCQMAATEPCVRKWGRVPVELERGELLASLRYLAGRWGWSVKKVRNFLEYLEKSEVRRVQTIRGTAAGTVYRIVSYEDYALSGHTQRHEVGTGGAQVGHKGKKYKKSSSTRARGSARGNVEKPSPLVAWGVPVAAVEALHELDGVHGATERGVVAQWGDGGTMERRWGEVPPDRRPSVVGTAILRVASDSEVWRSNFFTTVLGRCIEDELAPSPAEQAKARTSKSPAGRLSAADEERREADRRASARARQTQAEVDRHEQEEQELQERLEAARQHATQLTDQEMAMLKLRVKAKLKEMGPAAAVTGMERQVWLEVVEADMNGDNPEIRLHK